MFSSTTPDVLKSLHLAGPSVDHTPCHIGPHPEVSILGSRPDQTFQSVYPHLLAGVWRPVRGHLAGEPVV